MEQAAGQQAKDISVNAALVHFVDDKMGVVFELVQMVSQQLGNVARGGEPHARRAVLFVPLPVAQTQADQVLAPAARLRRRRPHPLAQRPRRDPPRLGHEHARSMRSVTTSTAAAFGLLLVGKIVRPQEHQGYHARLAAARLTVDDGHLKEVPCE